MSSPLGTGVVCQLLFVIPDDEGQLLVDFLPLEPLPTDDARACLPPGTPLTLGLSGVGDVHESDLRYILEAWANDCRVCRMSAVQLDGSQRLMISSDDRAVVVTVEQAE